MSTMPYKVMPCQVRLSSAGAAGAAGAAALCACARPVAANKLANINPLMRAAGFRVKSAFFTTNTPVVSIVGFNRRNVTAIFNEPTSDVFFLQQTLHRALPRGHISHIESLGKPAGTIRNAPKSNGDK